jgi:hypothetical protein
VQNNSVPLIDMARGMNYNVHQFKAYNDYYLQEVGSLIYKLNLEGFEGQNIEVKTAGIFSSSKLLVNGRRVNIDKKSGYMLLTNSDGNQVQFKWRQKAFGLDVPLLEVGGEIIQIAEPLKWFIWIWCLFPVVLVFVGGFLGAIIGVVAAFINVSIFRSGINSLAKWILTVVVSVVAVVIFVFVAILFSLAIGG